MVILVLPAIKNVTSDFKFLTGGGACHTTAPPIHPRGASPQERRYIMKDAKKAFLIKVTVLFLKVAVAILLELPEAGSKK